MLGQALFWKPTPTHMDLLSFNSSSPKAYTLKPKKTTYWGCFLEPLAYPVYRTFRHKEAQTFSGCQQALHFGFELGFLGSIGSRVSRVSRVSSVSGISRVCSVSQVYLSFWFRGGLFGLWGCCGEFTTLTISTPGVPEFWSARYRGL